METIPCKRSTTGGVHGGDDPLEMPLPFCHVFLPSHHRLLSYFKPIDFRGVSCFPVDSSCCQIGASPVDKCCRQQPWISSGSRSGRLVSHMPFPLSMSFSNLFRACRSRTSCLLHHPEQTGKAGTRMCLLSGANTALSTAVAAFLDPLTFSTKCVLRTPCTKYCTEILAAAAIQL